MTNTILTPTQVTREVLRVLHQKANFIGSVNRQYDDSFAKSGAKIGSQLKIRLPNEYTVRSGATLSAQDTSETSETLTVASQHGVDMNFTSEDLTMSLDDFSKRIIEPAASVLVAKIESTALTTAVKDTYQSVDNVGSALTFKKVLEGRKRLIDSLTPEDDNMHFLLNTQDNVDLVDALKGLFHDSAEVRAQYKRGQMGRSGGFMFAENTHMPAITSGTAVSGATGYVTSAAISGTTAVSSVLVSGVTTFKQGDIFYFSGIYDVHPETKVASATLKTFVVTADYSGGAGTLSFSPSIYTQGARQNVSGDIIAGTSIHKPSLGASGIWRPSLAYHKDAFTFVTADLVMPKGLDWSARENHDGISIRMVRQYDINNDKFPTRLDVLWGFKTLRAQLAARVHSN